MSTQAEIDGSPLSCREREILLAEEMALISRVDRVASVSDAEAAIINQRTGITPVILGHFHEETVTTRAFHKRDGLLFLGSYLRIPCPNFDAVGFLADRIVPELRRIGLDPPIRVAGFRSESAAQLQAVRDCTSISIIGTLTSLRHEYERTRLVIIPTRIAAGIAYKYTEALSFGVPCVVSRLIHGQTRESADLLPGCERPPEFAAQIDLLYRSERAWTQQREAGLSLSRTDYSRDDFDSALLKLLN